MKKATVENWAQIGIDFMSSLLDPNSEIIDVFICGLKDDTFILSNNPYRLFQLAPDSVKSIIKRPMYKKLYDALPNFIV